jgi:hypothetical protein
MEFLNHVTEFSINIDFNFPLLHLEYNTADVFILTVAVRCLAFRIHVTKVSFAVCTTFEESTEIFAT